MGGGKRLNGLEEEKNVNSEGEKDIRYFKKIYVIESLEIETKMYKKADHFFHRKISIKLEKLF